MYRIGIWINGQAIFGNKSEIKIYIIISDQLSIGGGGRWWMKKIFWQMFAGTRGGYKRGYILKRLCDKPFNANQLAEALNLDYKTTRHHLDVLAKNGLVSIEGDKNGKVYFLTKDMEANLNDFNQIWEKLASTII